MQISYLLSVVAVLLAGKVSAAAVERQSCPLMCDLATFPDAHPVKGDAAYESCVAAAATAYHNPINPAACAPSCEAGSGEWILVGVQGNGYTCID